MTKTYFKSAKLSKRVRSLDTLRSIAILLVILAHTVLGYGAPSNIAPLQLGGVGVDLFFVLSGWLLGNLLFKELESTSSVNIKRFWSRRWLRTLPAYYAVLMITFLQQILTKENPVIRLDYIFFIQNYSYPLEIFSISWSLAVEEQFYLLIAPLILSFKYVQRRYRVWLLLVLLFIPMLFRSLELYSTTAETHVRVDGCVMGVLLACVRHNAPTVWDKLKRYSVWFFSASVIAFIYYFYQRWHPEVFIGDPGYFTRAIIFGAWIVFAISNEKISYYFYFPFAQYIATRSYAMYLLHPEAIALVNRLSIDLPFFVYAFFIFSLTLVISEVLYRSIELPFMKARDKIIWHNPQKKKGFDYERS